MCTQKTDIYEKLNLTQGQEVEGQGQTCITYNNKNAKALKVHSVIYWSIYMQMGIVFFAEIGLKCTK